MDSNMHIDKAWKRQTEWHLPHLHK